MRRAPVTHAERSRRKARVRRVLLTALAVVILSVFGAAVWGYQFLRSVEHTMQSQMMNDTRIPEVLSAPEPQKPFVVLLTGLDKRPKEEVSRTDTIIVARVDPEQKKVWMVSIPRDTRAEIPGKGVGKINTAAYGGPSLVIETVEKLMGIEVNHYLEVDFRGFEKLVDTMGGVRIYVESEIDDWRAADHSPGHRAKHIDEGWQTLDGEHALTYVRSRDYPDADFTRMRHQQEFFRALLSQSTQIGRVTKIPGMVRAFAPYCSTDMSWRKIADVAMALHAMPSESLQTATLTGEWRSPYVRPDPKVLAMLSRGIRTGSDIVATSTPGAAGLDPASVSVTVRNGVGVAGLGMEAADLLRAAGFDVGEVGNAQRFVYDRTLVIYAKDKVGAEAVATALGVSTVVESRGMYAFKTDVLVVVGKDWRMQQVSPDAR